jgi:hypothetical protein
LTEHSSANAQRFAFPIVGLFILYYLAYRIGHGGAPRLFWLVLGVGLFGSAILMAGYPIGALDVYEYAAYGRIMVFHGGNPFVNAPVDYPGDPFLGYLAWPHYPAPYGPVWVYMSAALAWIGGDSLLANVLLFKGLAVLFYAADAVLIWLILRRTAPRYAPAGMLLFAWNPLVLYETAQNGHNDSVLIFFVLLALWLHVCGRRLPAVVALTLSVTVKFVSAPLVPLYVLAMFRWRKRSLLHVGLACVLCATVLGLAYAPVWDGRKTLTFLKQAELFTTSWPTLLHIVLSKEHWVSAEHASKIARYSAMAIFALFGLLQMWHLRRQCDRYFTRASFEVLWFYLLFACFWFQPWYIVWVVAAGAATARRDVAHRVMVFSATAIMGYVLFAFFWAWNAKHWDGLTLQALAVCVELLPALLITIYYALSRSSRSRELVPQEHQPVPRSSREQDLPPTTS